MTLDYKDIGKRIKTLRHKRGMTQTELAKRIDLDSRNIHYIENGTEAVSLLKLIEIADAMNISIEVLLGGSSPQL